MREPQWKESGSAFPPFPRREDLVALDVKAVGARYSYWIDGRSVTLDRDRVTRFTIVMQGAGGGVNVLYEGLRCATQEFKTYGYGTSEGSFNAYPKQEWKHLKTIRGNEAKTYLVLLYNRYMCDARGLSLNLKTVRRQLGGFSWGHDAAFEQ